MGIFVNAYESLKMILYQDNKLEKVDFIVEDRAILIWSQI